MNPNWLGVISAILAIIAFYFTYRLATNTEFKTRVYLTILSIILAIPGASFSIYYAHLLPEAAWYYQFRSIPGTEFLIIFLGIAGGLIASFIPRIYLIFPLLAVAAFAIAPTIKPFLGSIPQGTMDDRWSDDICLQSTPSTCGLASVATILKSLEIKATESELATEAHTYMGGTEAWYMARAVRARGANVRFKFSPGFDPGIDYPAIVGVRLDSVGHFIPILGKNGNEYIIGDPLQGKESISRDDLLKRYEFTGFYMLVSKEDK